MKKELDINIKKKPRETKLKKETPQHYQGP